MVLNRDRMMAVEYITIYRAWGEAETQVVRGLLESSGIKCRLKQRGPQSIYPVTVDGLAETEIMVPKDREAEAQAIVSAYRDHGNRKGE